MVITYNLGDALYINMTNRCTNACSFCLRSSKSGAGRWQSASNLGGAQSALWLEREPTVDEVLESLRESGLKQYKEVVFCGFGEPFMRFDDCKEVARWLKRHGMRVRANTNGQANLITGRDVTGEMPGLFDAVSISLNNKNAAEYQAACHSGYGERAFDALLDFGQKCAENGIETTFTVVDLLPPEDIAACRRLAEERGCTLRVRRYIGQ